MTIHLPEDLERFIQAEVEGGRFASYDELVAQAVRLLLERKPSTTREPLSESELDRELLASGFLASVPPPRDPAAPPWNFEPVTIEGEPISQTVLRDRR
jgi:putative addiction module CopG family antidote